MSFPSLQRYDNLHGSAEAMFPHCPELSPPSWTCLGTSRIRRLGGPCLSAPNRRMICKWKELYKCRCNMFLPCGWKSAHVDVQCVDPLHCPCPTDTSSLYFRSASLVPADCHTLCHWLLRKAKKKIIAGKWTVAITNNNKLNSFPTMHFVALHKVIILDQRMWAVIVHLNVFSQVPGYILIKDEKQYGKFLIHIQPLSGLVQCSFPADYQWPDESTGGVLKISTTN